MADDHLTKMDLREFWEFGYLQEVNRMVLNPLGLALMVNVDDETGEVTLEGVWDQRDDPEGIYIHEETLDIDKHLRVMHEIKKRRPGRVKTLGYWMQRVPGVLVGDDDPGS